MKYTSWKSAVVAGLMLAAGAITTRAITISGYSANEHDRFSGGFPTAPVQNTHADFVGGDYDWSGIAWSTTTFASSSYKGFAMLSPLHFMAAQHYEHAHVNEDTKGVRILNTDGQVETRSVASIANTGYGLELTNFSVTAKDIAIGVLATPFSPVEVARYGVLDLHPSSTSNISYTGLDIFLYGRSNTTNGSPRTGLAVTDLTALNSGDPTQGYLRTTHDDIVLQVGDSGSPGLIGWQNPNGGSELTVVGVNSLSDTDLKFNYLSWLAYAAAMSGANSVMNAEGFALRVVGNPSATWQGGGGPQGANFVRDQNWTSPSTPSDTYVLFDAAATSVYAITMNESRNVRGLYFKSTAATGDGFSFSGANTLTVGRGGITNYDNDRQTFTANIALGAPQYWSGGPGGITAATINTNGHLLEIAGGEGTIEITGAVSGSGALALTGGRMELSGQSSYTGATWVHAGTLYLGSTADISSSSVVIVRGEGSLAGTGQAGAIAGSGSIDPGQSPGILTVTSVDPSGGLSFNFEFTAAEPDYEQASASLNDVLRITDATPFGGNLTAANVVGIYLDAGAFDEDDTFRGGFFTDAASSFLTQIQGATFAYYVATPGGSVSYEGVDYEPYTGPLAFSVTTVAETANFGDGPVSGRVMQITVIPEPSTLLFAVFALAGLRMVSSIRRLRRG